MQRIASRDRTAFAAMYRAYHPRLFKFVFRLTNSHSTADELVNDVMLVVWRKADTFRGDSRVSTWVFGIAYRVAMRRIAKKRPSLVSRSQFDDFPEDPPQLELEDWVRRGIAMLPDAQQVTVVLVFYLGLSYEETAEVTECPVNTVKTRMFHARRRLKQLLEETSATCATTVGTNYE